MPWGSRGEWMKAGQLWTQSSGDLWGGIPTGPSHPARGPGDGRAGLARRVCLPACGAASRGAQSRGVQGLGSEGAAAERCPRTESGMGSPGRAREVGGEGSRRGLQLPAWRPHAPVLTPEGSRNSHLELGLPSHHEVAVEVGRIRLLLWFLA